MPVFVRGQRVNERWLVMKKLGEGQFAEVYEVRDISIKEGNCRFAMKVEKRRDVRSVKQEHKVVRRLQETCPQVCPVLLAGQLADDRCFIVMQLLGCNLVEARRAAPGGQGRFPLPSVRCLALLLLDALQAVHAAGFLHRDVKPANFAQVPGTAEEDGVGDWRLLDFGLARRYVDDAGVPLAEREDAAFRGSTTYASVHAHAHGDLSRRDDLWSWLYLVAELIEGTLPWRQEAAVGAGGPAAGQADVGTQRDAVAAVKQACVLNPDLLTRTTRVGGCLAAISQHLAGLRFSDTPDYSQLRAAIGQLPDSPLTPSLYPALPALPTASSHPSASPNRQWQWKPQPEQEQAQHAVTLSPQQPYDVMALAWQEQWQEQGRREQAQGAQEDSQAQRQHQHIPLWPQLPGDHALPGLPPPGSTSASMLDVASTHAAPHGTQACQQPPQQHSDPVQPQGDAAPKQQMHQQCQHSQQHLPSQQGTGANSQWDAMEVDGVGAHLRLEPGSQQAVSAAQAPLPPQKGHCDGSQTTPTVAEDGREPGLVLSGLHNYEIHGGGSGGVDAADVNDVVDSAWHAMGLDAAMYAAAPASGGHARLLTPQQQQTCAALETAAVQNVQEYLHAMRMGVSGAKCEALASELAAMHPCDAFAVVAVVLGASVAASPPSACGALSTLLSDVALYTAHIAKKAEARCMAALQAQHRQT